jgi:thymidylate synthase
MWHAALVECLDTGERTESRVGGTREVLGWSATLADPTMNFLGNEERHLSPYYAAAELLWYMSREDSTAMLEKYAPSYKNYAELDGRAYGAYGKRIALNIQPGKDQLRLAVECLRRWPSSRQTVVSLWRPSDLDVAVEQNKRDLPCTLTLQFMARSNKLHMITSMRSNDIWLGMPYDVFVFTCIQQIMACELRLGIGSYTHHVGSLHLYDKNEEAAVRAIRKEAQQRPHQWLTNTTLDGMRDAVLCEESLRTSGEYPKFKPSQPMGDMAYDILACCARELGKSVIPQSPALMHGITQYDHYRRSRSGGQNDAGTEAG